MSVIPIPVPDRPSFAYVEVLVADAERIAELGAERFGPDTPLWFIVRELLNAYDGRCNDCGAPTRPAPPLVTYQCAKCR